MIYGLHDFSVYNNYFVVHYKCEFRVEKEPVGINVQIFMFCNFNFYIFFNFFDKNNLFLLFF